MKLTCWLKGWQDALGNLGGGHVDYARRLRRVTDIRESGEGVLSHWLR